MLEVCSLGRNDAIDLEVRKYEKLGKQKEDDKVEDHVVVAVKSDTA